jgi:hypothetical protein
MQEKDRRDLAGATRAAMANPLRMKLSTVVTTFKKWLHLPDSMSLYVVLGALAANLLPGDPLWLLMIGPPGSGKTELILPLAKLANVIMASTLTEAALLSGTASRDKAKESSGGLLRLIGTFGILLCKDFTSVLSMNRDSRAAVLAALREIYDGSWTRHVGTDGGKSMAWNGKLGLIAGCTSVIDQHHAVTAAMGERFVMYRMPPIDEDALASRALDHQGSEATMRMELAAAVNGLFLNLQLPEHCIVEGDERTKLIALAAFTVRCRSSVERDGYTREVELIPEAEAPGRLALALARLLVGVTAIGAPRVEAWRVVSKVALDCIPALRLRVITMLAGANVPVDTTTVATAIKYPTQTTRRALEDLAAHGVVKRQPGGKGKADLWETSKWTEKKITAASINFPELSEEEGEEE